MWGITHEQRVKKSFLNTSMFLNQGIKFYNTKDIFDTCKFFLVHEKLLCRDIFCVIWQIWPLNKMPGPYKNRENSGIFSINCLFSGGDCWYTLVYFLENSREVEFHTKAHNNKSWKYFCKSCIKLKKIRRMCSFSYFS